MENPVILFDGVCNLCNSTVQFVIERDSEEKFRFAPLQSEEAEELLEEQEIRNPETLVLVEEDDIYLKTSAYIRILDELGGLWRIISQLLRVIPRPVRDRIYDLISSYRYRMFGKKDVCMTPDPDLKDRFLSQKS